MKICSKMDEFCRDFRNRVRRRSGRDSAGLGCVEGSMSSVLALLTRPSCTFLHLRYCENGHHPGVCAGSPGREFKGPMGQ